MITWGPGMVLHPRHLRELQMLWRIQWSNDFSREHTNIILTHQPNTISTSILNWKIIDESIFGGVKPLWSSERNQEMLRQSVCSVALCIQANGQVINELFESWCLWKCYIAICWSRSYNIEVNEAKIHMNARLVIHNKGPKIARKIGCGICSIIFRWFIMSVKIHQLQ